ncbi:MAG TPA: DegT/DnrJ/EryC1/StrS family aminotransferase [Phycisphaerae bacterium]|nr:DegT/DnrJ/EryC1/StrS family aminotransferase [Phycisphaerae bacterium]
MSKPAAESKSNTSQLACLGGVKTVAETTPNWPCPTDAEVEAVRQNLIKAQTTWGLMNTACGGGIGEVFENRFKQDLGVDHAVATSGGGPALHIACMAVLEMGDEAITTPYSWGQSVSCIVQAGGIPIFADIDPETLTLDPASIESKITPRTKAIVLCHIYGIPADMDAICDIAKRHNLRVIEDCAQAQGSLYKGKQVGTFGDLACFSLGSGKNIAVGEAGFLVAKDLGMYEEALLAGMHPARTYGEIKDPERKKWIDSLIYTYRVNALSASLGVKQLDRLEEMNSWRRKNYAALVERLDGMPGIRPQNLPENLDPAWHMQAWTFVPEDVPGVNREQYVKALNAEGVGIGNDYVGTPIYLRPMFQHKKTHFGHGFPWTANPEGDKIIYKAGDCPVAEKRCAVTGMQMSVGNLYRDVTRYLDHVAEAFKKVTTQLDEVRKIEL